jgi:hypothetical protein
VWWPAAAVRACSECTPVAGNSGLCVAVREANRAGFAGEGKAMQASAIRKMAAVFRRMLFLEVRSPQSNFKPSWCVDMQ